MRATHKTFVSAVLLVLLLSPGLFAAHAARPKLQPQMVRVAVAREARELSLSVDGAYTLRDASTGKVLSKAPRLPKSTVRLLERGVLVGLDVYPVFKFILEPARDATIRVNNRKFRGEVILIRTPQDRLIAVNQINIEDYVKGVLYHEVSHHWPMEALKAQAVATRTYALYSLAGASKDYDMTNDIYSQVYGGRESERYRTGIAVDRTAGQVLAYQGRVLPAYFHATCGGMTEDSKEMWNIDLAPLSGVPCAFCKDSPHFSWKKNFRLKDIQVALNRRGLQTGLIKDIDVTGRDQSGRIREVKITDRAGGRLTLTGKDFREVLGPNNVRSNNYEVKMQGYFVDLIGKGWGHGVGMCQWGARGMAMQQFNDRQILNYYYPHADIVDYHDLPKPVSSGAQ